MGEFKSQLKTLLKKNLLLKSKSKCGIVCEIIFPIIIVLIVFAILILVQAFKPNYDKMEADFTQFAYRIGPYGKLIYGSSQGFLNKEQNGTIEIMKLSISKIRNYPIDQVNKFFIEINNQELMESYFLNYSKTTIGGIWFTDSLSPEISNTFKYSIRLDSDRVLDNDLIKKNGKDSEYYLKRNFGFIQLAMDQSIFKYYNLSTVLNPIFGQRYPDPYIKLWQKFINGRESVFKSAGSVFVTAGLSVFVFRLVTDLVVEKETKIREGMKMMGMKSICYFLSWIITSLLTALPVDLIIIVILKGSQVIYTPSWGIVIVTLILYLFTLQLLAFIFSMFFDRSKFAGLLTFLIILVINICGIFVAEYEFNTSLKLVLCLISPIAIACSFYSMSLFDITDVKVVDLDYVITEQQVIIMLVVDIALYIILIWYLDNIIKSEYGTKEPWYFPFTKKYWYSNSNNNKRNIKNKDGIDIESTFTNEDVELIPIEIRNNTTIQIRNLRKEYKTGDGLRVAVNDLYLDMFDGQIHSLLGPNGSGKSTTIGMLTGLIQPTSGTAFIQGNDISYQISKIRRYTGVCLQTDIIWNQLTVLEHLMIYASLKGYTLNSEIKKEAKKMAIEVDLGEKLNAPAGSLSGGQKRKLCLGIAFIGPQSNIIFLDEPTSGMDPSSRRVVWDFLLKYKKGRTIIMSTHFLEEADYLSDRISIISHGKLITDGSSLYLKNKYGVGYLLTCSKINNNNEGFNINQVTDFIKTYIPDSTLLSNAGTEISYRLPTSSLPNFSEFFKEFDNQLVNFGIQNYGISVTTLEEVFLKIGTESSKNSKSLIDNDEVRNQDLKNSIAVSSEGVNSKQQLKGLLIKRMRTSSKDLKSFLLSLLLPLFVIIGSIVVYKEVDNVVIFYNNSTTPLIMSLNQYPSSDKVPIYGIDINNFNTVLSSSPYFNQFVYLNNSINFKDYLIENYKLSSGAINFATPINGSSSTISYNAFYNFNYIHSWPVHVNLINDALLRNFKGIGIETTSMPFDHVLSNFDIASQDMNIKSIVYFIIIIMAGFSLMAGSFAGNISQERTNRVKRLLYISGCKKYIYWLSNLIWDYFFAFILLILTCIILAVVDSDFRDQLALLFLSLVLYSLSIIPLSYLLSYKFTSFGKSTGAITAIHFAIGVVFTIVMINLRIQVIIKKSTSLENTSDIIDIVFNILSPLYAFSRILFIISGFPGSLRLGAIKVDDYWSFDYGAIPIIILAGHSIIWTVWIMLLDYAPEFKGYIKNPKTIPAPKPPTDEDSDVSKERERLLHMSPTSGDELQFKCLHKLFKGKGKNPDKNAVYNSTLGIPKGMTFGLLGLNGAGKTSTISMLSGDIVPTSGEIIINGHDLITDRAQALLSCSVCPQFDALITLLSAREQLWLYCRIKGVPENKIHKVVEAFIKMMDLTSIANSNTGGYSGGNKRKTSLSIAMLGNPSIVYLDEPSTGCDPVVRRFQWSIISELAKDKVIILTSHSMSEVEALCGRLTIMKDGKLMCLGSVQDIKSKFGAGYSIDIKFKREHFEGGLQRVFSLIPTAFVIDQHDLMASLELPNPPESPVKISQIFNILSTELSSILDDYSVSQTSLDQVFLKLTGCSHEDRLNVLNNQDHPINSNQNH